MEKLYKEINQTGEVFDIGQVSFQVKELLKSISEGKEIKKEKFSQVSPKALYFLQEKAQFLEENELKYILLHLLTEPKPENQRNIIKTFDEFLGENKKETKEKINQNKLEAKKIIYLNEALESARKYNWWFALLSFYSNPKNQNIRPELLKESIEGAIKENEWISLLAFYSNPENQYRRDELLDKALEETRKDGKLRSLLSFYSNPENQNIRPELLKETLENARKQNFYILLIKFYSNPQNQNIRPELLNEALEEAKKDDKLIFLLSFYSNPKNQNIRPELLKESLEKAIKENEWVSLLAFYSNPENQYRRDELLDKAIEETKNKNEWWFLLAFYSNPQNQYRRDELLDKALEGAIANNSWDHLLNFYSNLQNQHKLTKTIQDKIIKSIKTIADGNLRADTLENYLKYFKSKYSPLSLFLFSKNEDLPILIPAYNLQILPEVILSWNLTVKEKETILPILIDLNRNNIKFPFPFIFYPKKEIKTTKNNNELIIDYLRNLDFIANLQETIKDNLIENHFKNVENLIQKYNITQTTTEIPISFLKEIITNVKELKQEIFQRLKQILQIEEEIDEKQLERFIKESKYLNQLITLAIHYSKIYKEGLPLLGKIKTAMIQGTYFDLRYDLKDPITQEELSPLLENITDEQKKQKILNIWRENHFSFHLQSEEEIKQETEKTINYNHILEHLRSQIIDDKHYEDILNLISNIDQKDKETLSSIFGEALYGKTINFGNIKKILEKYQLSKEKINCFIGVIQLLRDLNLKKNPEEYLSSIERLEKIIKNSFQELLNKAIIEIDVFNYLREQLKQLISDNKEKITRKRILVSYFTDHPKTLIEIGAYPVSTCQNYNSTDKYNTKLLGYIFDAHIKALVCREIEIKEDVDIENLEKAKIEIDDNNEKITIILEDGRKIEAQVSKPIARRIVMLGKIDNQPALLLEPIYNKSGKTNEEIDYLNKPIEKLLEELKKENIDIKTTNSGKTLTPKSHNPAGYYREIYNNF
jgi:hypothetical protein